VTIIICIAFFERFSMSTALQPTGLMCNLLAHPEQAKIQNRNPKFGWIVNGTDKNVFQEAYQILVASSLETLAQDDGNMWNSGEPNPGRVWKSESQSINIPYDGEPLQSHTAYHWKVRTWNGVDNISPWSEVQTFHTGELTDSYTTSHYPLDTTAVAPTRVVQLNAHHAFIDFGRAAFGTLLLTLNSPTDTEIEIHIGEVPDGPHALNRNPGGARRYQMIPLNIQKGDHTYQLKIPTDPRNTGDFAIKMPDDLFEVYPFRYCEIIGAPVPITHTSIRQLTVHYPFNDAASHFTSSSRVLNDIWDMCQYTMKATSFCGYYVDGDRERIPYEADGYVNQIGHYGTDREYTLARRTNEYLLTTPTWPTEWHLYTVLIAYNDLMFTGNTASIAHHYEDLKAKTLSALAREDGLISTETGLLTEAVKDAIHFSGKSSDHFKSGIRDIVDWPQVERDGYDMVPINSVVNALHHRALIHMADIANTLDKPEGAQSFRAQAAKVKKAFQEKLIDPVTGIVIDGEGSPHSALHANIFALACGLVPSENLERVKAFVQSRGMACSVYVSQILLEALYAAGSDAYALSLLTSTGERSWAHMIYDVGTTIALEAWDNRFKPNQDWNHAWGAAPAGVIPFNLMGIHSLEPGFGKVRIAPQPGTLSWAQITTPTIRGAITVSFNNDLGKSFHLEVDLPGNMSAQLAVPRFGSDDPSIVVDGHRVFGTVEGDFVMVDGIGSGHHTVERFV
jgi:alpha-L-rhamnosidase